MGPAKRENGAPHDRPDLLSPVYGELRRLARRAMARERPGHTLEPTALANEAYLRLAAGPDSPFADRSHFAGLAARAMRRILIEHAPARHADKRAGDRVEALVAEPAAPQRDGYLLALDEALEQLARRDLELARIVELRFFGGYTVEETARILESSPRSVKRAWSVAKGWLHREITEGRTREG